MNIATLETNDLDAQLKNSAFSAEIGGIPFNIALASFPTNTELDSSALGQTAAEMGSGYYTGMVVIVGKSETTVFIPYNEHAMIYVPGVGDPVGYEFNLNRIEVQRRFRVYGAVITDSEYYGTVTFPTKSLGNFLSNNYRLAVGISSAAVNAIRENSLISPISDDASIITRHFSDIASYTLADRATCETDEALRQFIMYMTVRDFHGRVLSYRRPTTGNESRLHAKRSIGYGGHFDDLPIPGEDWTDYFARHGARELVEELPFNIDKMVSIFGEGWKSTVYKTFFTALKSKLLSQTGYSLLAGDYGVQKYHVAISMDMAVSAEWLDVNADNPEAQAQEWTTYDVLKNVDGPYYKSLEEWSKMVVGIQTLYAGASVVSTYCYLDSKTDSLVEKTAAEPVDFLELALRNFLDDTDIARQIPERHLEKIFEARPELKGIYMKHFKVALPAKETAIVTMDVEGDANNAGKKFQAAR